MRSDDLGNRWESEGANSVFVSFEKWRKMWFCGFWVKILANFSVFAETDSDDVVYSTIHAANTKIIMEIKNSQITDNIWVSPFWFSTKSSCWVCCKSTCSKVVGCEIWLRANRRPDRSCKRPAIQCVSNYYCVGEKFEQMLLRCQ